MNTKHTPGPWSVETVEYGDNVTDDLCILGPSPDFRDVANVSRCFQGDRIKEMEQANARLIAAAPDLLAALENLADMADQCDSWESFPTPTINAARAAIAKATGEPA